MKIMFTTMVLFLFLGLNQATAQPAPPETNLVIGEFLNLTGPAPETNRPAPEGFQIYWELLTDIANPGDPIQAGPLDIGLPATGEENQYQYSLTSEGSPFTLNSEYCVEVTSYIDANLSTGQTERLESVRSNRTCFLYTRQPAPPTAVIGGQ